MSNLFVYDMNVYLQSDSELQNLMNNNNFIIMPAVGYEDDKAPIILWTYMTKIKNPELPWWRVDQVDYHILDNDADRCLQIGERIINILNVVDKIDKMPSYNLGQWSFLSYGNFIGPVEKDGWYQYTLCFEVSYLPG